MNNLELLNLGKCFLVSRNPATKSYEIQSKDSSLAAIITEEKIITYYVTGCYNSGIDWLDIDIEKLDELRKFCELMVLDCKN